MSGTIELNRSVAIFLSNLHLHIQKLNDIEYNIMKEDGTLYKCSILPKERPEVTADRILHTLYSISFNDLVEEYIDKNAPFPYYDKSINELKKSLKRLESRNAVYNPNKHLGLDIVYSYNHSIMSARGHTYESPEDSWKDLDKRRFGVKDCLLMSDKVDSKEILYMMVKSRVAKKVYVSDPYEVKYLIQKYYKDEPTIFDPLCGYSGKMIGVCSSFKKYIGSDINETILNENSKAIVDLNLNAELKQKSVKTYEWKDKNPVLFTDIPEKDSDMWDINNNGDNLSTDDWIDLITTQCNCPHYLFVVNSTERYKQYVKETLHHKHHYGDRVKQIIYI